MSFSRQIGASFKGRRGCYLAAGLLVAGITVLSVVAFSSRPSVRVLRVGYYDFHPYILASPSGEPAGLAVDVVKAAAERSGVRLQWTPVADADQALRQGKIDLFPLLTITAERRRELHISAPWWEASQALLSRRDRPLADAAAAVGKRIAIRNLNFGAAVAQQRLPGAILRRTPYTGLMVTQVCAGEVDGALLDGRLIYQALLQGLPECAGRKLKLVPLPKTSLPMGTASSRAAAAVADRLFAQIETLALDGTMTGLANRWFVLPQQTYVPDRLLQRARNRLALVFAVAGLILLGVNIWHSRRAIAVRRAAEQALARAQQAEDRFLTFMAHSPALTFIKDAGGRWAYVNDALVRSFGFSREHCLGKTNADIFPAKLAAQMDASDAKVVAEGRPLQDMQRLGTGAEARYFLVLKFPLTGSDGERCIGGAAFEVTDQQRAAELVKQSRESYRTLFEEAPVPIHEIDSQGIVRRVNRAGCELLGLGADEIIGRHCSDFVGPQEHERSLESVREKLSGRKKLEPFERSYRCRDGGVRMMEVHETAILDEAGSIRGIRTCMVDLTERKQAQARADAFARELQEKNAALAEALKAAQESTRLKSQFLANMSHEIRTPMNGVLGMTELLMKTDLTQEQRDLAQTVTLSGRHLLAIINDILDISKIEAARLELESTPFELAEVVESAVELMAPPAHAKGLELTSFVDTGVPPRVVGDPARLRQVLLNLLGNAVKFTSEGEVAVRVEREQADGTDTVLRFLVRDTGIGVPPAARDRIFTAFMQADCSTTRKYGGTGLGLAIAQRIVDLMRGQLGIESDGNHGSTFWFTARFAVAQAEPEKENRAWLNGIPVLIVDDNATSRAILEEYARAWGMRPLSAAGGPGALELMALRAESGDAFRLALIDMRLPGMDGAALAPAIAADPRFRATRLVTLTSIGSSGRAEGVAACISKPVKRRALFDCICRVLEGAEPGDVESAAPRNARPATPRGRILVAEDNPVNQRVARLQVQRLGFEVDVVENGAAALNALERRSYSMVLMDCQMPHMDGYEATRELRRRQGAGPRLPVVAMTANAYAADREACLQAGMDDYLSKPVELRALEEVLHRWAEPIATP